MPLFFSRAAADQRYLFQSQDTSVLAANFEITAASGVYEDTGLSISLPSAGVYRLFYTARGVLRASAGDSHHLQVKMYNETDAEDVEDGNMLLFLMQQVDSTYQFSGSVSITFEADGAKTINLYARRTTNGTISQSIIASNADGRTTLSYQKVSN